jgi:hypothetical protein
MNTKAKLFTGAIALVLATSAVFSASNASARPYDYDRDHDRYDRHDNGKAWWKRERDERDRNRRDRWNDREFRYGNRDRYRYDNRRNIYIYRPSERYRGYDRDYDRGYNRYSDVVQLPAGCRKVVYRDRIYYTRNNSDYYTYDQNRRGFVVVNFPGVRIGF